MKECPSRDWITFGYWRLLHSAEAKVRRRLWKVKSSSSSPACFGAACTPGGRGCWGLSAAHTVGGDETGVLPPKGAQPFFALACPVCSKSCYGGLVEGHAAPAGFVLWRP